MENVRDREDDVETHMLYCIWTVSQLVEISIGFVHFIIPSKFADSLNLSSLSVGYDDKFEKTQSKIPHPIYSFRNKTCQCAWQPSWFHFVVPPVRRICSSQFITRRWSMFCKSMEGIFNWWALRHVERPVILGIILQYLPGAQGVQDGLGDPGNTRDKEIQIH